MMRLEGRYNDTGERWWEQWYVYSVSDTRGEEKPMQIFAEEVTYWAFRSSSGWGKDCSSFPSRVLSEEAELCFQLLFMTVRWLQGNVIPSGLPTSKKGKQTRRCLPAVSPSLVDFKRSHLGWQIPSPHQSTKSPNTKPIISTFPSLHQASWQTGSKCIKQ